MSPLLLSALTLILTTGHSAVDEVIVFEHVEVIPVHIPGVLHDQTVIIRGDPIATIAPAAEVEMPAGATVIDGRGCYLIPGLVDMHDHMVRGEEHHAYTVDEYFNLHLAAGVTTIRTMRGADGDVQLRDAIEAGERQGTRLIVGSPGMNGDLAPDPETARARVVEFSSQGYDFLKVLGGFSSPAFEAMAKEAGELGMPLAGHLPRAVSLELALSTPFLSIEHLHGHGSAYGRDPKAFIEIARCTAEAGVWVCPTLGFQISHYAAKSADEMALWPGIAYAPPRTQSF